MARGRQTADPALKYYFEMLGLPLTASEKEVRAAFAYFTSEQDPSKYLAGSAEQKKAEAKLAELKFANDKLLAWFKDNPEANSSSLEFFQFAGNAEKWKKQQSDVWAEQLKDIRKKESQVWAEIQAQRKKSRLTNFIKRTKILTLVVAGLAFSGLSWHHSWEGQFRQIQAQNLFEETAGRFPLNSDKQGLHDSLINKAQKLKASWNEDDANLVRAWIFSFVFAGGVVFWWLPTTTRTELIAGLKSKMNAKKVA